MYMSTQDMMTILDSWLCDDISAADLAKKYSCMPVIIHDQMRFAKSVLANKVASYLAPSTSIAESNIRYYEILEKLSNQYHIRTKTIEVSYKDSIRNREPLAKRDPMTIDNLSIQEISEYWGDTMPMMSMEEVGELLQAISKHERKRNLDTRQDLIKEMADMYISLMSLQWRYGIDCSEVQGAINRKVQQKYDAEGNKI